MEVSIPYRQYCVTVPLWTLFNPDNTGSTFGGNPLGVTIAQKALEVVRDEKLMLNARRLGKF